MAGKLTCDECGVDVRTWDQGNPELFRRPSIRCPECQTLEQAVEEEVARFAHEVALGGADAVKEKRDEVRKRMRETGF
jgi:uncharacterized Zn finger protein (UPF0148 family)